MGAKSRSFCSPPGEHATTECYAPQTKIFDGGTKHSMSLFEALFKVWILDLGYYVLIYAPQTKILERRKIVGQYSL